MILFYSLCLSKFFYPNYHQNHQSPISTLSLELETTHKIYPNFRNQFYLRQEIYQRIFDQPSQSSISYVYAENRYQCSENYYYKNHIFAY